MSIWPGSRCSDSSIHSLTCWRYSGGTPSIWVITSTGKNTEKSATTSNSAFPAAPRNCSIVAVIMSVSAPMARGVNTLFTRLRITRCSGGSMEMMHLRRHLLAAAHHAEIDPVCRRVRLEVPQPSGDVGVPAQRVEVVLLAVVHRRLSAQPRVDRVRVAVEVGGERIEHQLCGVPRFHDGHAPSSRMASRWPFDKGDYSVPATSASPVSAPDCVRGAPRRPRFARTGWRAPCRSPARSDRSCPR